MLKLIKNNIKQYLGYMIISIVLLFINSLTDLYLPNLNADITNNGMAKGDVDYILRVGAVMLIFVAISVICMIGSSYCSSMTSGGLGKNMRRELFAHIATLSKSDIDSIGAASLVTRQTNDVNQVQNAAMMIFRMMLKAPIMFIGGIILAVRKSPQMSWIIVVCIPLIALLMYTRIKRGMPLFTSMQTKIDKVNQVLREYLSGIRVIRAFIKDDYEKKRFSDANEDLMNNSVRVMRMMALIGPSTTIIVNAANIAIVWIGGKYMIAGKLLVGDISAFITYVAMILGSVQMMSSMFIMIPRASASADRINEVLNIKPNISDAQTVLKPVNGIKGEIVVNDVSFTYPDGQEEVISNISFECHKGEVTAIIGGTGSGKSSVINLIPRFYDPDKGNVLLDGMDVRSMSQEDLRSRIGYVPQKSFLFTGTVAQNIRFGKKDASDEEIVEALKISQAYDFVMEKGGINSEVTQGGNNFSGGQKQRLAIARAMIRKPEVYIFDDSFSALDFATDAKLRKALMADIKETGATAIIVAQRVSTIRDADRIVVLDEGNMVGMGTHDELIESCEVYREIVESQISEKEVG